MKRIVALFGPSGCGKDTIKKSILDNNPRWNNIIPCTTRPKREGEQADINYHFLTEEEFVRGVLNGEMVEATSFNDWFYGTQMSSLKDGAINIGIFNLNSLEILFETPDFEILPVFIAVSNKERLLRALEREACPNCTEICRRFLADEKDFSQISSSFPPNTLIFDNELRNPPSPYLGKSIVELAEDSFLGITE